MADESRVLAGAMLTLIFNRRRVDRDMDALMQELDQLEAWLRPRVQHPSFVSSHSKVLLDIRNEVESLLREPNVRPSNGRLIGFRDRVFNGWMPDIRSIHQHRRITMLFNEFVKGITCFSPQLTSTDTHQPVYHRHGSCAPRGEDNHDCIPTNTMNVRRAKKSNIETCWIERQIYDEIWSHLIGTQDVGHLTWLRRTEDAYTTCFPTTKTVARVSFDQDTNMPISVILIKTETVAVDDHHTVEEYFKTPALGGAYEPYVLAIKTVTRNGTVSGVHRKTCTFDDPSAWT